MFGFTREFDYAGRQFNDSKMHSDNAIKHNRYKNIEKDGDTEWNQEIKTMWKLSSMRKLDRYSVHAKT